MKNAQKYWKAILAAFIPLAAIVAEVFEAYNNGVVDGTFDTADQVKLAIAVLLSIGVYAKANTTNTPAADADLSVRDREL